MTNDKQSDLYDTAAITLLQATQKAKLYTIVDDKLRSTHLENVRDNHASLSLPSCT